MPLIHVAACQAFLFVAAVALAAAEPDVLLSADTAFQYVLGFTMTNLEYDKAVTHATWADVRTIVKAAQTYPDDQDIIEVSAYAMA